MSPVGSLRRRHSGRAGGGDGEALGREDPPREEGRAGAGLQTHLGGLTVGGLGADDRDPLQPGRRRLGGQVLGRLAPDPCVGQNTRPVTPTVTAHGQVIRSMRRSGLHRNEK